jgi:hypothetical protein
MNDLLKIVLFFSGFIGVHIFILHLIGPNHFIRNGALLLLGFLGLPVLTFGGKLIFVSLWNMYMFALICSRNSVSLRILDETLRAPGGALSKQELLDRFSDSESLSSRISLMEKNAFLHTFAENEVELLPKGRFLARSILFARNLFGVANPG